MSGSLELSSCNSCSAPIPYDRRFIISCQTRYGSFNKKFCTDCFVDMAGEEFVHQFDKLEAEHLATSNKITNPIPYNATRTGTGMFKVVTNKDGVVMAGYEKDAQFAARYVDSAKAMAGQVTAAPKKESYFDKIMKKWK